MLERISSEELAKYLGCLEDERYELSEEDWHRRLSPDEDEERLYRLSMDPFELDYTKIFGAKSLARLINKTQVATRGYGFNPHVRTRMRHTMDVVNIAGKIAAQLRLNKWLSKASALGHDIGHMPYGHTGEVASEEFTGGIKLQHEVLGVVVAQEIDRKGKGLNLNWETLLGILHHSRGKAGLTINELIPLECSVAMFADKFGYVFADISDIFRLGLVAPNVIRKLEELAYQFGASQREREDTCISALVKESFEQGTLSFSECETAVKFLELKDWLYENVYKKFSRKRLVANLLCTYELLAESELLEGCDPALLVCLLTDTEVNELAEIKDNTNILSAEMLHHLGIGEIYQHIRGKVIDIYNPDLNWMPHWRD